MIPSPILSATTASAARQRETTTDPTEHSPSTSGPVQNSSLLDNVLSIDSERPDFDDAQTRWPPTNDIEWSRGFSIAFISEALTGTIAQDYFLASLSLLTTNHEPKSLATKVNEQKVIQSIFCGSKQLELLTKLREHAPDDVLLKHFEIDQSLHDAAAVFFSCCREKLQQEAGSMPFDGNDPTGLLRIPEFLERQRHIQETCKFGDPRYPQLPSSNAQMNSQVQGVKMNRVSKEAERLFSSTRESGPAALLIHSAQKSMVVFRDAEHHYSLFDPTKHIQAGSSACSSVAHQTVRACLAASLIHTEWDTNVRCTLTLVEPSAVGASDDVSFIPVASTSSEAHDPEHFSGSFKLNGRLNEDDLAALKAIATKDHGEEACLYSSFLGYHYLLTGEQDPSFPEFDTGSLDLMDIQRMADKLYPRISFKQVIYNATPEFATYLNDPEVIEEDLKHLPTTFKTSEDLIRDTAAMKSGDVGIYHSYKKLDEESLGHIELILKEDGVLKFVDVSNVENFDSEQSSDAYNRFFEEVADDRQVGIVTMTVAH